MMPRRVENQPSRRTDSSVADGDSISNHSIAPPPRYSYRRESNNNQHADSGQSYIDNVADVGGYLMQPDIEEDLGPRLPSPHSTENLRSHALLSDHQNFSTIPVSDRCSRPCSTRAPSPHPIRRHSSGHKRDGGHQRPESCPIHGYTHTHSQCLPEYASTTTPTFDNDIPPVPRLTAGDFRRLAHSLHSHSPHTFNVFQDEHLRQPSDEFGYAEQMDPFYSSGPQRSSSLHQYRSVGSYNNPASYIHQPVFNHRPPQMQESPITLSYQRHGTYPAAISNDGEPHQNDAAPAQFCDTKENLGQDSRHVAVETSSVILSSETRPPPQRISVPTNLSAPTRPRSSCKPLKITKKASVHGPLSSSNAPIFSRPIFPLPANKPTSPATTPTNYVHLSRTTTPPSKKPLFLKSVFKPLKTPDRADARHLIFNNGLRKSLSPSSSIVGQFVIDPTLNIPGGLLRAVDSSCLPLEDLDLDLPRVLPHVQDTPAHNRLERSKSEKRVDLNPFDTDPPIQSKGRKNLVLEVKNGGIDVDVHLVPSDTSQRASPFVPTVLDLYVKDTVMRKRKGNKIKAVRNTQPFPLIARIVAPHPRPPIHVVATTMPLPKTDMSPVELIKTNSVHNSNAYTNPRPSSAHAIHRRTQSQPSQTPSRRPTSSSGLSRSPSARTSKTRTSYIHPIMPTPLFPQNQSNGNANPAVGSGSGSGHGAGAGSSGASTSHHSTPTPVLRHLSLPLSPIHLSLPNTFRGALVVRVSAGNIDAHLTLSAKVRASAVVLSEKGGVRGFFVGGFKGLTDQSRFHTATQPTAFTGDNEPSTTVVTSYVVSDDPCDFNEDDAVPESSDLQHVVLESDRDDNIDEDDKVSASSTSGPDSDLDQGVSAPFSRKVHVHNHEEPNKAKDEADSWQGDRLEVVVGDGHVWLQFEDEEDPFGLSDGFWMRLGKSCGIVRKP